jgi:N-acetylglucosamine-6-phosphate deacetylase
MRIFAKRLFDGNKILTNMVVTEENGIIAAVESGVDGDLAVDLLSPGLIDVHHHGAWGFDTSRPALNKAEVWARKLAENGVAGVLYTIATGPKDGTRQALAFAKQIMARQAKGEFPGARILGVHLEGPFISEKRSGAMNKSLIRQPSISAYEEIAGEYKDIVRVVTLAPEVPGAIELVKYLSAQSIRVQAGHTDAAFEQTEAAFLGGVTGICHFFNAARPIAHRDPGPLTAALLHPEIYSEIICDMVHVDYAAIRLVLKCKGAGSLMMISDSAPTAGLPDGSYYVNNHPVIVREGKNYTESGGIAGSGKQTGQCVRFLCDDGFPIEDVLTMATVTPARWLSMEGQLGAIKPGCRACLSAFHTNMNPAFTLVDGQMIYAK